MMKITYRLFFISVISIVWLSLSGYKDGPAKNNARYTGAPFDMGNCGSCHKGGSFGTVTCTIQVFEVGSTTPITAYKGGKNYDVKITINSDKPPVGYGFQMVAVSGSGNVQAGTWSGFPTNINAVSLANRTYVEHKAALTANSQKMTWTAPAAGSGTITFYAGGNCVDKTGAQFNDNAGVGTFTLAEAAPVCTTVASISASGLTELCQGTAVNLTASGGTAYKWSNGATTATLLNITTAGTYTVTVSEGNCAATASKTITVYPTPSVRMVSTAPTNGSNGTATAIASGGTPPYKYRWSNNATNNDIMGLAKGLYKITVTDANGCAKMAEVQVGSVTKTADVGEAIGFNISPVPNDGHFRVALDLPSFQTVLMEVYDVMGQNLVNRYVTGQTVSEAVDITAFHKGFYLVKIKTDLGVAQKWVVLTK